MEIFIVDDDASVREGLVDLFEMEGYRTRALASGDEAWRAINRGAQPAAIVLDLWLPDMSGGQFIARLRASAHGAIPVVMVSGSGRSERLDCDADASFRKPVEGRELVRAVDRLVARGAGPRMPAGRGPSTTRPGGFSHRVALGGRRGLAPCSQVGNQRVVRSRHLVPALVSWRPQSRWPGC